MNTRSKLRTLVALALLGAVCFAVGVVAGGGAATKASDSFSCMATSSDWPVTAAMSSLATTGDNPGGAPEADGAGPDAVEVRC